MRLLYLSLRNTSITLCLDRIMKNKATPKAYNNTEVLRSKYDAAIGKLHISAENASRKLSRMTLDMQVLVETPNSFVF